MNNVWKFNMEYLSFRTLTKFKRTAKFKRT